LKLFDTRFDVKNSLVHCYNLLFYLRSARDSSHCQEALKTITKQGPFSVINSGRIRPFLAPRNFQHNQAHASTIPPPPCLSQTRKRQSNSAPILSSPIAGTNVPCAKKNGPALNLPQAQNPRKTSPSLPGRGSGQAPPSPQSLPRAYA
jgi:hypothetical protein